MGRSKAPILFIWPNSLTCKLCASVHRERQNAGLQQLSIETPTAKPPNWPVLGLLLVLVLAVALLWRPSRFPPVLPPHPPLLPPRPLPFATLHPHTQNLLRQLRVAPERVTQGLGSAPASAGIHGADGSVGGRPYCAAFDLSVSDLTPGQTRALLRTLRGAGIVCWWRVPGVNFPLVTSDGVENGPHIHGVDPFVPHKERLEQQIRE